MVYILLIVIIVILVNIKIRINESKLDLIHLYAMLSLIPRKFDNKGERDFYIATYRCQSPMFYSAEFVIRLDVEKFLESKDSDDYSKEHKEEILKKFNDMDWDEASEKSHVQIKLSNNRNKEQCWYAETNICDITIRVAGDKIYIPSGPSWFKPTKYFDFKHWITLEMLYQRIFKWKEMENRYPAWHSGKEEWDGWKIIRWESDNGDLNYYFEKDYISISTHISIWDRNGNFIDEYNIEDDLPSLENE